MNSKASRNRRLRRLATPESKPNKLQIVYDETGTLPPKDYPDPWLFDTMALLAELDHVREAILRIPARQETFAPINAAVAIVWELRQRLQYLLTLTKERQRSWQAKTRPPGRSEEERGSSPRAPAARTVAFKASGSRRRAANESAA